MGGNIKYIVRLSASEREALAGLVNQGKVAAAKRKRAHIRRNADVAVVLREGADVTYADADKMVLVALSQTACFLSNPG